MSRPIVVVGDVLLDVDVLTSAERLTPDGPVPVLDEIGRRERPGGAALTALLAARDPARPEGCPVVLLAPVPDDDAGRRVLELVGPSLDVVVLPCAGSTPVKTRLRCGDHTVARLDNGTGGTGIDAVPQAARDLLSGAAAVLVSDYGGGVTTDPAVRELLTEVAARVPVVWDPHPRGGQPVPNTLLVTPNAAEAARLAGGTPSGTSAGAATGELATTRRQAELLVHRWQARAVAVTRGPAGALLSFGSGAPATFPAQPSAGGDACGAGDRFAARAVCAVAGGALPSEAVADAVVAASAFVADGGASALELDPALATDAASAGDRAMATGTPDADRVVAAVRARGGTVVATGGCFDLLHAGHVATLAAARALGDCLVVLLNSDDSVRRLKGDGRPLQGAADRARLLTALRSVDAVVVFDDDTPSAALARLRPDVWVKGGDYAGADLPEAELLRTWGGEVVTVPYLDGRSTTGLVGMARR